MLPRSLLSSAMKARLVPRPARPPEPRPTQPTVMLSCHLLFETRCVKQNETSRSAAPSWTGPGEPATIKPVPPSLTAQIREKSNHLPLKKISAPHSQFDRGMAAPSVRQADSKGLLFLTRLLAGECLA